MCKNSNRALNALQPKSCQPSFNSCIHLKSRCCFFCWFFLLVLVTAMSVLFNSPQIMNVHHKHAAAVLLPFSITCECPPMSWARFLVTWIEQYWNMFCPLFLSKHMWNTFWFHGWSVVGCGRAAQGWIAGVWTTCNILPLHALISVFISSLCNIFSFMVELTQVSTPKWFNTHISFTCLAKCLKAHPLWNMWVCLASLVIKRWWFFWFLFITYISSHLSFSSKRRIGLKNILWILFMKTSSICMEK